MEYTIEKIKTIVDAQKAYFNTNVTLDIDFRLKQLQKLKKAIIDNEEILNKALNRDLGRSDTETYLCDIGPCIIEINETIKGLRKWARPELHLSGLMSFPSIFTRVYKLPYGVTLIMSPYNFPFLLTFGALVASIASGNTAIIKPSSKSKNCTKAIKDIISKTFKEEYITVIDGGHEVADMCLSQKVDKIFYTGSPEIAKHVLNKAAENLIPVALELGGENGNYAIVRKDADIKDAARKIAFVKALNAGQICININQVAVAKEVAKDFIEELKKEFIKQIGERPCDNENYAKLIDEKAYDRCLKEATKYKKRIVFGGKHDKRKLKFEPTIIYPVDIDEEIVKHELFSPLLPIIEYEDDKIDDLLNIISLRQHPLSMYFFTKDLKWAKKVASSLQFGGACINEVCYQVLVKGVPFNGVGHSGMGAYHGEWGFREFSHPQTVLIGSTKLNLPFRVQPYTSFKNKVIKLFEK